MSRGAIVALVALVAACHHATAPPMTPHEAPVADRLAKWDAAWARLVRCTIPRTLVDLDPRDALALAAPYSDPPEGARCNTDLWRDLAAAVPTGAPPDVVAAIADVRARAEATRRSLANRIDDFGSVPDYAGHHRLADVLLDLDEWSADWRGNTTGGDRLGHRRIPRAPASRALAPGPYELGRAEGPYHQNPVDHAVRVRLSDAKTDLVIAEAAAPSTVVEPEFLDGSCATATTSWTAPRAGKRVRWVAAGGAAGELAVSDAMNLSCAGDALLVATDAGYAVCSRTACTEWTMPPDAPGGAHRFADLTTDHTAAVELRADGPLVTLVRGARYATYRLADEGETVVGFAMWSTGPTVIAIDASGALRAIALPTE